MKLYIHTFVDLFQDNKKQALSNIIKDKELSKIVNQHIDSETEYTKLVLDANYDTVDSLSKLLVKNNSIQNFQDLMADYIGNVFPKFFKK